MTQQVKTLCSYLLNSHQSLQKNIKLSYLKAFFIQKAIIFTQMAHTLCIEIGKPNLFIQDFLAKPYLQSKQLLVLLS